MGSDLKIPFIGQAYENRSIPVSSQRSINWYPEIETPESRNVITMQTAAGIKEFLDIDVSAIDFIRGLHFSTALQLLFVVSGNELYQVTEAAVKTLLGTITGSGSHTQIASRQLDSIEI